MTSHDPAVFTTAPPLSGLDSRIATLRELAATPGAEVYLDPEIVDYEAWNHVGDPLCEALIGELRERKMMGGDIFANARALEAQGCLAAQRFFADAEAVPEWCDFEAMRPGAEMAKRNPIGLLFGMHGGLPFTYIDPATAEVMGSTGRLASGGDYQRRYWETATGFIGALDVDGMRPGGPRWEQWVRIRFLHTMIRLGILRAQRWDLDQSMPISQLATAAATHIFGPYRVNIIEFFGGTATPEEKDSFALMWRWISRIEGANNQILGRTADEQFGLSAGMHQHLYGPTEGSQILTRSVIDGSASMKGFILPRRLHSAIVRMLLSEPMLEILPGRDVPTDFAIPHDPAAERAVRALTTALWGVNRIIVLPMARRHTSRVGMRLIEYVLRKGLRDNPAQYRGTPVAGQPTDQ
ncbi:DUF2236 domain-containing protein [Nocardia sp. NPDC056952]|uniref:DUF2236 domain-containing protein n=1 Tax=Nocardia sp. NPDC056952 TaxID=3345979 RepID=UPI0036376571